MAMQILSPDLIANGQMAPYSISSVETMMDSTHFVQDNENAGPPHMTTDSEMARPFVCNICKRSYSRVDHLARHHRSHTLEKPFSCGTCGKAFARADLLKRHSANHNNDRARTGRNHLSSPSKTRVAQACVACAAAKLRCGHQKPCTRCVQKGILCITSPNEKQGSGWAQRSESEGDDSINQLSTIDEFGAGASPRMEISRALIQLSGGQHKNPQPDASQMSMHASPAASVGPNSAGIAFNPEASDVIEEPDLSPSSALVNDDESMALDDSSLADFLHDIMMPPSTISIIEPNTLDPVTQPHSSRDIFNFGIESSLDFDDFDFGWMTSEDGQAAIMDFNLIPDFSEPPLMHGQQTPDVRSGINLGAEAFQKSLWRWAPGQQEHGYAEQINLSLPDKDMEAQVAGRVPDILNHRLDRNTRDRVLAMVLSTVKRANIPQVVTSFPPAELFDSLMHLFFRSQLSKTDSWIHLPTFNLQTQRPELTGIVLAAGAILSGVPTVRKLGFAIQEAVRLAVPKIFEANNSTTRELQLLQSLALQLDIGLWSGNKRKMEMAESHMQPLITMLRRAGRYRCARLPTFRPEITDDSKTLEGKWHCWVESESWKRLAFHTLIHDAEASISLLVRPAISYAEVSLELPCSQALWRANSAVVWRDAYLKTFPNVSSPSTRLPSLVHCIHDIRPLRRFQESVDLRLSTSIILHAMWSLISEYRQLEFVSRIQSPERHWNGGLISTSWHQDLCQLLDHFRLDVSEWNGGMGPDAVMIQELFMMNLHVAFEELQLFAGKEGSEEAQRVYLLLRQWFENRKSRQAIWHAGQVLRTAMAFPPNHLRDFYAVALYNASLALWVYGMLSLGTSRSNRMDGIKPINFGDDELIWLDGDDSPATRRFIAISRGCPVIQEHPRNNSSGAGFARLDNPRAVMEIVINVLSKNCTTDNGILPPLVENLSQLVRDLGNAAWIVSCR